MNQKGTLTIFLTCEAFEILWYFIRLKRMIMRFSETYFKERSTENITCIVLFDFG